MKMTPEEQRCMEVARLIVSEKLTIRQAAKRAEVSKSTIHKDIHKYLWRLDPKLFSEVIKVFNKNFDEKHIRGGNATRLKYKK